MSDKIVDLNRHTPSVESVISRLDRHQGEIGSITCVINWKDGSLSIVHDAKEVQDIAMESLMLQKYITDTCLKPQV